MKKAILIFLIILVLSISITGCTNEKEDMSLKIGSMPTQSASIYAVGVEKGIFEKNGVKVDLTIFKSAPERDAAATAKEVDGFMTDMMGLINLVDKDFKFKITSYEYENFAVMANKQSNIKNKVELSDARIGISENTVIEYVVDQLLDESKVEKVPVVKIPDRLASVLSDELQLGVFPEPFISIIKANGGTQVVSSAEENLQPVVVVFSEESIEKNDKAIKSFYKAYNETIDYMKETSYDEYKDVLVKYGLVKEDSVDKIKLPLEKFGHAKMPSQTDFNKVIDWMSERGLTEKAYELKDVSIDEYIN